MEKSKIEAYTLSDDALEIEWGDGRCSTFHYVWLRDTDPENWHSNGQRLVDTLSIPLDIKPASITLTDTLNLEWANDGHMTHFDPAWLRQYTYEENIQTRQPQKKLWQADDIPIPLKKFALSRLEQESEELRQMLAYVRDYGFALLTKIPTKSQALFHIIDLFGYVRDTNYGPYFDVKVVTNPSNLAFTSATLKGHTDNPYRHPVPTLQLLHVLNNNVDGGDSTLVDGFRVANDFRQTHQQQFDILVHTPVTFRYRSDEADLQCESTIIQTNPRGEVIGIRFNNRSMQPLYAPPQQIKAFYEAYHTFAHMLEDDRYKLTFKLQAGEGMLFDNQRVLHGRIGYQSSGDRHLQGCYADIDSLLSKLAVLEEGREA